MTAHRPTDEGQLVEAITSAVQGGGTLEIVAGGTKRALGRPVRSTTVLDMGSFDRIMDYEPSELVVTLQAATPLSRLEAQLRAEGQMLAFEPPDWRALLRSQGEQTIGGVLACNLSGPRRIRSGAARDHLLGFSAVNGWGEAWKAGGRVVKNVTGYDMCKLQVGAFGTLSVMTEVSVRVLPRPETSCTVVVPGLADDDAIPALAMVLNSPHEVSGAAHLPAPAAGRSRVPVVGEAGKGREPTSATLVRVEGHRPSVDHRAEAVLRLLGGGERLGAAHSEALWAELGSAGALLGEPDRPAWRVCPPPSAAPGLLANVRARHGSAEGFYDWGGGSLWISLDPMDAGEDCGATTIRSALSSVGGHATLVRAPEASRATVPVFQPATPGVATLLRRVKASFDPRGVLNPGRMHEEL